MQEIWKDIYYTDSITGEIIDYRGLYPVSNYGRIKSLENNNSRNQYKGTRLLKIKTGERYSRIGLSKLGKQKNFRVHRLVAHMFIPNPNNLPLVNHINEFEKHNNHVNNLEWISHSGNVNYGTRNQRSAEKHSVPVIRINKDGSMKYYKRMQDTKEDGFNPSHVGACCRGNRKTHGGCKWKYYSELNMTIMSEASESQ